jgi:hypothetical protein
MHKPHDLYTPTELLFLSLPPEQLIWWVGISPTGIGTLLGVPRGCHYGGFLGSHHIRIDSSSFATWLQQNAYLCFFDWRMNRE